MPQRLARRLSVRWESMRSFPLPRYTLGTPKIGGSGPLDPFFPPTSQTLAAAATSDEAMSSVIKLLEELTPNDLLAAQHFFLAWGRAKYGDHWRFANITTMLWAAATLIEPTNYLEIGVQRGRSAAIVGSVCPDCAICGFDLWIPEYAGVPNPGPDFVRSELQSVRHRGEVTLVSGDSRQTLPAFLREHPDLYFDLITFDGDKSIMGAGSDFANALPRLKVGGIVVFDDMPLKPVLRRIWDRVICQDGRYVQWEFADAGKGVAAAIRVSDGAPLAPRRR
ncbi:MAG: class I SAM-dependent methyltransferase [Dehalococcoidia bacterium]